MREPKREILVLYYSAHGSVKGLARKVALGIEKMEVRACVRTLAPVSLAHEAASTKASETDCPYATLDDLARCDGLALGSPTRFGNMAAPVKYFWDTTSDIWQRGQLIGKPAAVFTSTSSMHGGQETTLLSMMLPLFHHGMLLLGLPYSEPELATTETGGSPYGASHVAGTHNNIQLSSSEERLAFGLGKRLAEIVKRLNPSR